MEYILPTSDELINREKQKKEIAQTLNALIEQDVRFQGLEFYGLAGIGKSRVLNEAKAQCRQRDVAFAVIDFLSPGRTLQGERLSVLVRLCDQLDHHLPLERLRGALTGAARSRGEKGSERATVAFCDELTRCLGQRPLVLMLDSAELCELELLNWLGRELVTPLANGSRNLAVMLSSRGPRVRESQWPAALKKQIKSFRLDPLEFQATALHIRALPGGMPSDQAAKHIYDLSVGHPYSTEALISWLRQMGASLEDVEIVEEDLAQRLHEQVIRRYVLAHAERWVQPMLEVASIPRWFDPGVLRNLVSHFRPKVGAAQPIQYYVARISDLIDLHLVDVTTGGIGYQEEPTLRRLLNAVLTVLKPEEMAAMHEKAIEARKRELRPGVDHAAFYALEILYHLTQKTLIEAPETVGEVVGDRLDLLLQEHFLSQGEPNVVQATQLRHRLHNDQELKLLAPKGVLEVLVAAVDRFLEPSIPHEEQKILGEEVRDSAARKHVINYLVLEHFAPTEYRSSCYRAGRVVLPTRTVRTSVSYSLNDWRADPEGTGRAAYRAYLPKEAQDYIQKQEEIAIQLQTDWADIPWELLHDGEEFLCVKWPMARQLKLDREPREPTLEPEDAIQALVIGDPTEDLPGARAEAKAVAALLEENGVQVDCILGDQATPEVFSTRVATQPYSLLHFAGHGYFNEDDPHDCGLVLAQKRIVFGEELERVVAGGPFVFLSACQAGAGKTKESQAHFRGKYAEGVAISALLGGAIGCLSPMWVIPDGIAKDFALEFYTRLLEEMPIGEAVRRARVWAKSQGDPDFWAAWILCGEPLKELTVP